MLTPTEVALTELSYQMENLANEICRAHYDSSVSMDRLADMEAEFDRLHGLADRLVKSLVQETL